jgi:hypothetical protein
LGTQVVAISKRAVLPAEAHQCRVSSERGAAAVCLGIAAKRVLMFDLQVAE